MFEVHIHTETLGWTVYTLRDTVEEAQEIAHNLPPYTVYRIRKRS